MDKNTFAIYNGIVAALYSCSSFEDMRSFFLTRLKMLIPFSYASILIKDDTGTGESFYRPDMYCLPDYFAEAEHRYVMQADEDPLLWLIHGGESTIVRESEMLSEDERLNSALYTGCYRDFDIYDSLQYSIVSNRKLLGVVTLFRNRASGEFTDDSTFYLRSLGPHINSVFEKICRSQDSPVSGSDPSHLSSKYGLTPRETEILGLILEFRNPDEIASALDIAETTVHKHMQNIFRKTEVSSRWELLRL